MVQRTIVADYALECGHVQWTVDSVAHEFLDYAIGIVLYTIDVHTVAHVEGSSFLGLHGRLSQGSEPVVAGPVLNVVDVRRTSDGTMLRLQIARVAMRDGSKGGTSARAEAGDARRPESRADGVPSAGGSRSDDGSLPREEVTRRLHHLKPDAPPLFREPTIRLEFDANVERQSVEREDEVAGRRLEGRRQEPAAVDLVLSLDDEVFWEIARVFCDRDRAVFLVMSGGFPRSMVPAFTTPLLFWAKVLEEAQNGALPEGLQPMLDKAAAMYPGNPIFSRSRRELEAS